MRIEVAKLFFENLKKSAILSKTIIKFKVYRLEFNGRNSQKITFDFKKSL